MDENKLREIKTGEETVFDGHILHVRKDSVRLPNGSSATREHIVHVGAVCIVPVTDDGMVCMERQFRYPLDRVISEIPAGKLDRIDEDRLEAAKRELREETGLTADRWTDMGLFYPAAAYSNEKITMFLAEGLHQGRQELDEDEFLNVSFVPLAEVVEKIMSGEITDGKTQVAVLKAEKLLRTRNA